MKTTKIAAGYYNFQYKGQEIFVSKVEGKNQWYYQIGIDGSVDDWHSSKQNAIDAAIEYLICF